MLSRLEIHHSSTRAAERVARWHNIVRSRLLMLVVAVVLSGMVFFWQRQKFNGFGVAILIIMCAAPLLWLVIALVWSSIAKRDLACVGDGIAMLVDAHGVVLDGLEVPWEQVKRFTTRTRGLGRSPLLIVERADGESVQLALDHLDVLPSQIDDAARAWTRGRVGLDLASSGVN